MRADNHEHLGYFLLLSNLLSSVSVLPRLHFHWVKLNIATESLITEHRLNLYFSTWFWFFKYFISEKNCSRNNSIYSESYEFFPSDNASFRNWRNNFIKFWCFHDYEYCKIIFVIEKSSNYCQPESLKKKSHAILDQFCMKLIYLRIWFSRELLLSVHTPKINQITEMDTI